MIDGKTIIRVEHSRERPYVILAKTLTEDGTLSWEARGIMAYLLGKPDDWEVNMADLVAQSPAGKHVVYRILAELEERGYLDRKQERSGGGTFGEFTITVHEQPLSNNQKAVATSPLTNLPHTDEPLPVNRTLLSNDRELSNEGNRVMKGRAAATPPAPPPASKAKSESNTRQKTAAAPDPLLQHPAVVAYRDYCHLTANHEQRQVIASEVEDDLDTWREVLRQWMLKGWRPNNVDGILDRYRKARSERDSVAVAEEAFQERLEHRNGNGKHSEPGLWEQALEDLRLSVPAEVFAARLLNTTGEMSGDVLTVVAPNEIARQWLDRKLRRTVERAVVDRAGRQIAVMFAA